MKNILSIIFMITALTGVAQTTVAINQGETVEGFVTRIAPTGARQIKFLLADKFNTSTEKLVYCYALFEEGNILNNTDSSLCFYVGILSPIAGDVLKYTQQTFKTVCSYKKSTRIETAQVVEIKKEKRLQTYIAELVRGPGGVPRDVKRTFEYKQEMEKNSYKESFIEVELK